MNNFFIILKDLSNFLKIEHILKCSLKLLSLQLRYEDPKGSTSHLSFQMTSPLE